MIAAACALVLAVQPLPDNPVAEAVRALGRTGFKDGKPPAKSPTAFKPEVGRRVVERYAKQVGDDDAQRAALAELLPKVLAGYEDTAAKLGTGTDASGALAFSIAVIYAGATGKDLDDAAYVALIDRFRASLDVPAVRGASDAQKQDFYEWSLCAAGLVLSVAALAETPEAKAGLARLAKAQLEHLLGADVDRLTLKGKEVALRPAPGVLPAGFSFTPPDGWTAESGWHMRRVDADGVVRAALVRFPAAIPAGESMGAALGELWTKTIPNGIPHQTGGMVFRRLVGDGLVAQFIFGAGVEEGRKAPTVFSLYLVDLDAVWQPVIVAVVYDEAGNPDPASKAKSAFPGTFELAEPFLASLRCPAAKGRPLVAKEALVGDYHATLGVIRVTGTPRDDGSGRVWQTYGVYVDLKADGTYRHRLYAEDHLEGKKPDLATGGTTGTWAVQDDRLVLTAARGKGQEYRVAGLAVYPDGEQVAVLLTDLKVVPGPATLGDPSNRYSTKKP